MRATEMPCQAGAGVTLVPALTRRMFMVGVSLAAAMPAHASDLFDAVVEKQGAKGAFTSVAAAIAAAPTDAVRPWRIRIGEGVWQEKLLIKRRAIHLVGAGRGRTILSHGAASGLVRPEGGGNYGTYGSASLTVEAADFQASGLTVRNDFDYVGNLGSQMVNGAQAVALALGPGADRSILRDVEILGHQDSFYLRSGRALVENSLITGSVDFIFGGAAALLRHCEIRARFRPGEAVQGFVAAPSTPENQPVGLVFRSCRLTRETGVPDGSVYLGRPWRAGGNMQLLGACTYLDCWMDAHIHPEGWTSMGYTGPDGTRRQLAPQEARLFEHQSRGPGAGLASTTRRFLAAGDLAGFADTSIWGDWRPA